jgi:hypothetical protein
MVAALATLVACAGGSQTQPPTQKPSRTDAAPAAAPAPAREPATDWLTNDSPNRTATISLEVRRAPGAPSASINGYRAGEARVIVPLGWTVKWEWRNTDSTTLHSLVIMTQREKIPLEGGHPAFINAMTRMLTGGLPVGQTDQTNFQADEAGWFWIMCGVPEHAVNGEWVELRVDPEATSASIQIKKR